MGVCGSSTMNSVPPDVTEWSDKEHPSVTESSEKQHPSVLALQERMRANRSFHGRAGVPLSPHQKHGHLSSPFAVR